MKDIERCLRKATSGDTLVAQIVQRFASVDKYGAPAHDITKGQPMVRSSTWQQPLEGRDNVVDGPLVLLLVVAESLVGGGGCFRERVRGAHSCHHARGVML